MRKITSLFKSTNTLHWSQELVLLIPRIACGFMLACMFGGDKFGVPWSIADTGLGLFEVVDWFPKDVEKFGGPFAAAPELFAWLGAASEAIGGMLLLLGLFTRPASFLIMCTMLTAIFFQKWGQGTWNMLPAMGFLWVSIYHLVHGSGKFGLDTLIHKYLSKKSMVYNQPQSRLKAVAALTLVLSIATQGIGQINGEGPVTSERYELEPFHKVAIHLSSDVDLVHSDQYFIEITVQENLLPYIKKQVSKERLIIDQKEWIESSEGYKVTIGSPYVDDILLTSWSDVHYVDIDQEQLKIKADVGTLHLQGQVQSLLADIEQANIFAQDLVAQQARIDAQGYARLQLNVIEQLDIKNKDGRAKVDLVTEPKIVNGAVDEANNKALEEYYKNAEFIHFTIKNNSSNRHNFYVVGPKKDGTTFSYGFPMMPGATRDKNWSVGTKVYKENRLGLRKFLIEITADNEGEIVNIFN